MLCRDINLVVGFSECGFSRCSDDDNQNMKIIVKMNDLDNLKKKVNDLDYSDDDEE